MKILVLLSGQGSNLQALIDACQRGEIAGHIVAVISNKADAFGLVRAQRADIPTHTLLAADHPDRASYDAALLSLMQHYEADLVVLASFMRILSPTLVRPFLGKMINIHPSLLPRYPGLHTHQRAIDDGAHEHGASVHFVTERLDAGPVILQTKVEINADDDADSLALRVLAQEHQIYPQVVQWFCQGRLRLAGDEVLFDGYELTPLGAPQQ